MDESSGGQSLALEGPLGEMGIRYLWLFPRLSNSKAKTARLDLRLLGH